MTQSPLGLVQAALQAYIKKDRSAIEALLADDFRFTSPIDNGLDRATYLEVCWPNNEAMKDMKLIYGAENGDRAFIVYEVQTATKRFRNSEVHMAAMASLSRLRSISAGICPTMQSPASISKMPARGTRKLPYRRREGENR